MLGVSEKASALRVLLLARCLVRAQRMSATWSSVAPAIGSAVLVRATFPPFDFAPLALLAWVPLLVLVPRLSLWWVLAAAALQGLVLNLSAQGWLVVALERQLAAPLWVALVTWFGLAVLQGMRVPLVMALVHLGARYQCPLWLGFPVAQAATEQLYPLLFPWTLALQVHDIPEWLQVASWGGGSAVSVWLGLVNGLLAEGWLARQRPRALFGYVSAATLIVLVISVHGHWAIERSVTRESNAAPARVLLGHVGK